MAKKIVVGTLAFVLSLSAFTLAKAQVSVPVNTPVGSPIVIPLTPTPRLCTNSG